MNDDISAIIPARAGSKGIINKNIIDFCGKPLLAWSIEVALQSHLVMEVYVSTDGEEIAEIAESFGAKVIWRPKELSTDESSSESAIAHAMEAIEKNHPLDLVLFLQATSPIRKVNDIDEAIEIFHKEKLDSLFSMSRTEDYCLWKREKGKLDSVNFDYHNRGRRQEREPLYLENGSIYIFKPKILREYQNRLGGRIGMYEMPFTRSYEIDCLEDMEICEFFMKKLRG